MKFSVNKNTLKNIDRLVTKGKFTVNGSDGPNIVDCNVYVADGDVMLVGSDTPGTIWAIATFPSAEYENGSAYIPDLVGFYNTLKQFKGECAVEFNGETTKFTNSHTTLKSKLMSSVLVSEFDEMRKRITITDGFNVKIGDKEPTDFYYTMHGDDLNVVYDAAYKEIKVDTIAFKNGMITLSNEHNDKEMVINVEFDVLREGDVDDVRFILPILRNVFRMTSIAIDQTDDLRRFVISSCDEVTGNVWVVFND